MLQLTQSDAAVLDDALARVADLCRSKDGRLALTSESAASRVMLVIASLADEKHGSLAEKLPLARAVQAVEVLEGLLKASRETKRRHHARRTYRASHAVPRLRKRASCVFA